MRTIRPIHFLILLLAGNVHAQNHALDPEALPPTVRPAAVVHFVSIDGAFKPANTNWQLCLRILTGGDHKTEPVTVGGHSGVKVSGIKFNTADDSYPFWADKHAIDILMQVYGDEALLDEKGKPRYFNFLTGTLPEPIAMDGGALPPEIKNGKWNWVLFRIPNGLRHMDGGRLVGTIHPKARGDTPITGVSRLSGQNGGTIRMDGLHDLKVRFVAFGEKGAFGEPEQINIFSSPAHSE
ncbi:MAG: hypothetical protein JWR69_4443 [Pedosphaera sp.]|nr:hypothetical protein [Pedosphaera sp.]